MRLSIQAVGLGLLLVTVGDCAQRARGYAPGSVCNGFCGTPFQGESCSAIEQNEQTLLNQFVDASTERNCAQDSDCVVTLTATTMCGQSIVNKTAAQGYFDYFASSQYIQLNRQHQGSNCGPLMAGTCALLGTPGCVQGQCVSKD